MQNIINAYSGAFPFWNKLSEQDKKYFCDNSSSVKYKKGTAIHDSTECTGGIIVKSGCVRVYMLSDEGKEITLYRLYPNDFCVLSASCVLQSITFDVFVDAEQDSECYLLSSSAFAKMVEKNECVKIFALETAVSRFSDVMWVMQQILFMSMDKRLAIFLLDEASKENSDIIKLTHEQIAKYMGSAREVVSRMLKHFSNEGLVELSRKGVKIVDKSKLRELAI